MTTGDITAGGVKAVDLDDVAAVDAQLAADRAAIVVANRRRTLAASAYQRSIVEANANLAEALAAVAASFGRAFSPKAQPVADRGGSDGDALARMGTDASVWAAEFVALFGGDEGLMLGWFANAIEAGRDAGTRAASLVAEENAGLRDIIVELTGRGVSADRMFELRRMTRDWTVADIAPASPAGATAAQVADGFNKVESGRAALIERVHKFLVANKALPVGRAPLLFARDLVTAAFQGDDFPLLSIREMVTAEVEALRAMVIELWGDRTGGPGLTGQQTADIEQHVRAWKHGRSEQEGTPS